MQVAIDHGWCDTSSDKSFIWQIVYVIPISEGSLNRLWLFYGTIAPSIKEWPKRKLNKLLDSMTL